MSKRPASGPGPRYILPILTGKLARAILRLRKRGTSFPGVLANRMSPTLLTTLFGQFEHGLVFVLGSNGKTTTTHMISEVVRAHGVRVFTNPSGANMPQGLTSSLLALSSPTGKVDADIAILEVDEGYSAKLAERLSPSVVVALNIVVDQLYRLFETERVADMLLDTAKFATDSVVISRDDSYLSKIDVAAQRAPVSFFGVAGDVLAAQPHGVMTAPDLRDDERGAVPHAAAAEVVSLKGREAVVRVDGHDIAITLPVQGVHFATDAAAALLAAARILGDRFDPAAARRGFAALKPTWGRGEVVALSDDPAGEKAQFLMFKNAPSIQLNLDSLDAAPEHVLFAIDDGLPDVSFLYDADVTKLDHVDVVTGNKAHLAALRFAHAGVPVHAVEPDMDRAIEIMRGKKTTRDQTQVWIVNYEQMMFLRHGLGHGDQEEDLR
ncbi:MAG: MurT ligase domain-containing protein [Microbacterium sp.]|uniref:MurT ligase domain-containing protein n=1 Tax=Microbacterium sp. TaxID=51671 RepID=UPI0039E3FBBD